MIGWAVAAVIASAGTYAVYVIDAIARAEEEKEINMEAGADSDG